MLAKYYTGKNIFFPASEPRHHGSIRSIRHTRRGLPTPPHRLPRGPCDAPIGVAAPPAQKNELLRDAQGGEVPSGGG